MVKDTKTASERKNTGKYLRIERSLIDYTNAYYVLAAALLALLTGRILRSFLDMQPCYIPIDGSPIDFLYINGRAMTTSSRVHIKNLYLKNLVNRWNYGATPVSAIMTVKRYYHVPGKASIGVLVLHSAAVGLRSKSYELLSQNAAKFLFDDVYRNPGPLQFDGPGIDAKVVTLCVEDQDYMGRIKKLQEYLEKMRTIVKSDCSQDVLKAALRTMTSVTDIFSIISAPSSPTTPF